jgi:hypothetical protein
MLKPGLIQSDAPRPGAQVPMSFENCSILTGYLASRERDIRLSSFTGIQVHGANLPRTWVHKPRHCPYRGLGTYMYVNSQVSKKERAQRILQA